MHTEPKIIQVPVEIYPSTLLYYNDLCYRVNIDAQKRIAFLITSDIDYLEKNVLLDDGNNRKLTEWINNGEKI